jgi:photosystem II stability/assembly factor-like uncharacterized protein
MTKKFILLSAKSFFCLFILFSIEANAQQTISYKEMMEDNSYNFYEVVKAADAYFDANGRGKGSGSKGYERWKNENESKYAPSGDRYNVDHYTATKAYQAILAKNNYKHKGSFDDGWEDLGPYDANNITSHYSPGIGRVETFWVDPNNSNTIYLGSRSGGFWKTTNGGNTWKNTTDFLVASGVRTIDVNPNNKNEILINVQHGGNGYTYGIYRSTDAGETWSPSLFVPSNLGWGGLGDNERIYKIAYHPTVANKLFIGTTKGLYTSTDNLATWTSVYTGATTDVAFHPTNDQIIYAFKNSGTDRNLLQKSSNGGTSFVDAGSFANNSTRQIFISVSASEPTHVYAASTSGVYKSTDEGDNFSFLSNPDETGLAFSVSDLDINNMIYGYVDLYNSTNNGQSFTQRTSWSNQNEAYIHADLRTSKCINGVFYVGTDGYLAKSSDNGVTWTTLNDGTGIREFYAVGSSQGNIDVHMAGSQDNGTSIRNADGWIEWNGGDGMEALIHPLNADWMIGSWQYGSRNYTRDGGFDGRRGTGNPNKGSGEAAWEAPFLQNPMNQMQVLHFSDTVWTGDRFGQDWKFKGAPELGGLISEADIATTDSNVIAVSRAAVMKLTTDGGQTWNLINNSLPGYTMTDIAFDPKDENTILITYNRYQNDQRKIYITHDQGATWENITYDLGNMPLRTVTVDHSDSSYIYVGGEIGVYYKSMNGTSWTLYDDLLPNVTVKDLEVHYGSNTLKAATWGRGLWQNSLIGKNNFPSITHVNISQTPNDNAPKENVDQRVTATIAYDNTISSAYVAWSEGITSAGNILSMENIGTNQWRTTDPISAMTLEDNVYFRVIAVGTNADTSISYLFHYDVEEFAYCDAAGSPGTGSDYINKVELADMSNSSGKEGYGDFTSTTIDLARNTEYTMSVALLFSFAGQDSVTAWIDYNYDAQFSTDEQIIFSTLSTEHTAAATFTVPESALMDKPIRMRVRSQYFSSSMTSCDETAGEVEDYTINIIEDPFVGITEVAVIDASLSPNPSNGSFQITLAETAENITIELYDITGKVVVRNIFNQTNTVQVDTELSAGTYLVKVSTEKGITTQKVIIK